MKALSIRQPWAWLVVHGHKPVENRTWPTSHRGDTLIHAGLEFDSEGLQWVQRNFPALEALLPTQYELGGIVGRAQLIACTDSHPSRWFVGPWGFVMHDAKPMPLVKLRGQLGFFDVPMGPELHAALQRAGVAPAAEAEAAGQERLF
jgi:hypothetical protein